MTASERADGDFQKARLLNRRLPHFEAMLAGCVSDASGTARRRAQRRSLALLDARKRRDLAHRQASCQSRSRSTRGPAPGRTRGSRRTSRSSSDDPGGDPEPPGLRITGRQASSLILLEVVA